MAEPGLERRLPESKPCPLKLQIEIKSDYPEFVVQVGSHECVGIRILGPRKMAASAVQLIRTVGVAMMYWLVRTHSKLAWPLRELYHWAWAPLALRASAGAGRGRPCHYGGSRCRPACCDWQLLWLTGAIFSSSDLCPLSISSTPARVALLLHRFVFPCATTLVSAKGFV